LLCAQGTGCAANGSTHDGIKPFTSGSDLSTFDLSTPNEAYFARADRMIQLAAKYGFLVVLDPAETISWLSVLRNNGLANAESYGRYLGARYKHFSNIIWMSGNDFQSWRTSSSDVALVQAVAKGIKETAPSHMHTVLLDFFVSSSLEDSSWAPIISLNAVYTYFPTYAKVLDAYRQSPTMPVFLAEANYELENNNSIEVGLATPARLRRQEYWALLSGAMGQLYGNAHTWRLRLDGSWKNQLDTPGAAQMACLKALFKPRAWHELVPDAAHNVVIAGYGTRSSSGSIDANDYVTAARTPNGKLVMAYVPSASRTITVDMSQLSGFATARWYDPASGKYVSIAGSPFANMGFRDFGTPGRNTGGDNDWVLVLEVE
jgi:hypothetical protein